MWKNKRAVGTAYEEQAVLFLQEKGYVILERNYRCRTGEIDIVARDGEYVVFVEVKYRSLGAFGSPEEAVDYRKQRVISRIALTYLLNHGCNTDVPVRFDVVSIEGKRLRHYRNAFPFREENLF